MCASRMLEKAERLVASGRIEPLGEGVYNVVGDHGTYTVVQDYTGKLSCSCPGFLQKAKCSHVTAVMLMTKIKRRRKPSQTRF
jgi:predicted nucleic acid-binding Zn finger protein